MLTARRVPEISVSRTYSVGRGVDHAIASQELTVDARRIEGGGHRATTAQSDGKLCVTYTGDVVPCIFQRASVLGNVRDGSLLELLTTPLTRSPSRGLPLAEEVSRRLQCTSCRVTEVGLALLRGAR
jgi:MoaA/NifB/PqqE/SkfB family radical SAM enzyme